MAFFGLTGLGSQSPFDVARDTPLFVFERADFQDAFMQTFQPGFTLYSECELEVEAAHRLLTTATITYDQLPTMLQHLYKCPRSVNLVPASALMLVRGGFAAFESSSAPIVLDTFLCTMEALKVRAQHHEKQTVTRVVYTKDGLRSREFISNSDYRSHLVKHERMAKDPVEKHLVPMTDTQTLGWSPPTIVTERKPTKSCDETKYASAMVKAGVYYY